MSQQKQSDSLNGDIQSGKVQMLSDISPVATERYPFTQTEYNLPFEQLQQQSKLTRDQNMEDQQHQLDSYYKNQINSQQALINHQKEILLRTNEL